MSEELKPCPFCGGQASLNYERIHGKNKRFWRKLSAMAVAEGAVVHGRGLIVPQRE